MAIIRSGATVDQLTIDVTSKAARVSPYASDGTYLGMKQTFSACTGTFTPAANTTDLFRITGSASKVIRVWSITFSGVQTTAGNLNLYVLVRRSTDNTGGTFVNATVVPHDSNNSAATVVVGHYTANPSGLGTTVGNVRAHRVLLPAVATAVQPPYIARWEFGQPGSVNDQMQPIVLRGTAQLLVINGTGAAIPTGAGAYQVDVVWTEE